MAFTVPLFEDKELEQESRARVNLFVSRKRKKMVRLLEGFWVFLVCWIFHMKMMNILSFDFVIV